MLQTAPKTVFQDNLGTTLWCENVQKKKMRNVKHVDIKCHYVSEVVSKRTVTIRFVPSTVSKNYILTKVSAGDTFALGRFGHGVRHVPPTPDQGVCCRKIYRAVQKLCRYNHARAHPLRTAHRSGAISVTTENKPKYGRHGRTNALS